VKRTEEAFAMEFEHTNLETCSQATGIVVVIDVLRAFTTAAYALDAGARQIIPVSTVEEALHLRARIPNALAMGEVKGVKVKGFDFGNSPTELNGRDLGGRILVQRTSSGTQGIVRSQQAATLLAASLVCARATADFILNLGAEKVTFVITGQDENGRGDDDQACADYIQSLLLGEQPPVEAILSRVRQSREGLLFVDGSRPGLPASDLDYSLDIDRFDFAMQVSRSNGLRIIKKNCSLNEAREAIK
jgi:2-phosphosulfolactate phosphatase